MVQPLCDLPVLLLRVNLCPISRVSRSTPFADSSLYISVLIMTHGRWSASSEHIPMYLRIPLEYKDSNGALYFHFIRSPLIRFPLYKITYFHKLLEAFLFICLSKIPVCKNKVLWNRCQCVRYLFVILRISINLCFRLHY